MKRVTAFVCFVVLCSPLAGRAAINVAVTQGEESDLAVLYSQTDLIQGIIATELPGDRGWHDANSDPLDKLPAFTDGQGMRDTGLTGLLSDFPPPGQPAKLIEYALPWASDISEVRVFTGNNGRDGRVFHTYTVAFSTDGGAAFSDPIYVQSHPSGTLNNSSFNQWRVVLSQLRDDSGFLVRRATHIRFHFYGVDNTQGQCRDPFSDINPFTGMNDGLAAPITSPLVWEIDVIGPPRLEVKRLGTDLSLRWVSEEDFVLQSSPSLDSPQWQELQPPPTIISEGGTNTAVVPITPGNQFLRLWK